MFVIAGMEHTPFLILILALEGVLIQPLPTLKKKKFLIHEFTLFLMLRLVCGIQVVALYGAMPQFRRIETYKSFVSKQAQCLFHNHLLQNLHGHEKKICRIK